MSIDALLDVMLAFVVVSVNYCARPLKAVKARNNNEPIMCLADFIGALLRPPNDLFHTFAFSLHACEPCAPAGSYPGRAPGCLH